MRRWLRQFLCEHDFEFDYARGPCAIWCPHCDKRTVLGQIIIVKPVRDPYDTEVLP